MGTPFSQDIKKDLNKLERFRKGSGNALPVVRAARGSVPAAVGVGTALAAAQGNAQASGLESPLTMTVTATKTINIPVPTGATSVDVQVVQKYKLVDASGEEFDVTVQDYP